MKIFTRTLAIVIGFLTLVLSTSTAQTTCQQPASLAVTELTGTSADVEWRAITGTVSYQVQYKLATSTEWLNGPHTIYNYATITGLQPGKRYQWRVATQCGTTSVSAYTASNFTTTIDGGCNPPTDLSAAAASPTAVQIDWTSASSGTDLIEYKRSSSNTWLTYGNATAPLVLTGLTANTSYDWRVSSICGSTRSTAIKSSFKTPAVGEIGCTAPTSLTQRNITANTVDLDWSDVTGSATYAVQYRVSGTNAWSTAFETVYSEKTLTGLAASTTYEWRVATSCTNEKTSIYVGSSFTTKAGTTTTTSCTFPTGLRLVTSRTNMIEVAWNEVYGAFGYKVEYRAAGQTAWTEMLNTSYTSKEIYGLQPNTEYQVRVATNCGYDTYSTYAISNFSTLSTTASVTTAVATTATTAAATSTATTSTAISSTCAKPINLRLVASTKTSLEVAWNEVYAAFGYKVQYRISGATTWKTLLNTVYTSKTINNLQPNTEYQVRVATHCGYDTYSTYEVNSFMTKEAIVQPAPTCSTPTNLQLVSSESNMLEVDWNDVYGAFGYKVEYRKGGDTNWETMLNTVYSTKLIYGLQPDTEYQVRVATNCGYDTYSTYLVSNFRTKPATTSSTSGCKNPLNLRLVSSQSDMLEVAWDDVYGAFGYKVEYRKGGDTDWETMLNTVYSTKLIYGLLPNTEYQVRVATNCGYDTYSTYTVSNFSTKPRISSITSDVLSINFYPNPVETSLRIESPEKLEGTVLLMNSKGYILKQTSINGYSKDLSLEGLQEGQYLLKIQGKDGVITKTIVKQ